jgi:ABC-type multidrug transport system fused ATPase/permease subunit
MEKRINYAGNIQYEIRKDWSRFNAFGRFFTLLAKLITITSGGILLYFGKTDFSTVFFFIAFTDRIYSPIMELFEVINSTARTSTYYHKAKELLHLESEKDSGTEIFQGIKKEIRFQNIQFSYPSNDREVLSQITFTIQKGQKIAFIGHTGSGKSTITQLLMRFYEPSSGTIEIDGKNIYDYTLESYRGRFAAVFQDTTLFNETIRHNLEYVRDGITEDMMYQAAKEANILDFIESLPTGWDTEVGERGMKLS